MGCADATVRVLYDPRYSNNGIMTSILKKEKKKKMDSFHNIEQQIITPDMEDGKQFNPDDYDFENMRKATRNDPIKTKKPDMPL